MRAFDPAAVPDTMPAAALTVGQLRAVLRDEALTFIQAERKANLEGSAALPLVMAAKLAHRRQDDVRKALLSGALKGTNRRGRWLVVASAVRSWVESGCPVSP